MQEIRAEMDRTDTLIDDPVCKARKKTSGSTYVKKDIPFVMIPQGSDLDDAEEAYYRLRDKFVPFIENTDEWGATTRYHVRKNCVTNKKSPRSVGYLYNGADKSRHIVLPGESEPLIMYGYHSYGGHYMFFRPDIVEVTWLLLCHIPEVALAACDKIYCTTEAYPAPDRSAYDSSLDRHQGMTKCYLCIE